LLGHPVRGVTIGGDDYLIKPFSVEDLVIRVQAILSRTGKLPSTRLLTCGDLVLDDDAHVVTRHKKVVPLSATEYKLLRFLLRNTGRVMSTGQILDHVWHYEFEGDQSVVQAYISMLRKKIESRPPRLIHTVRGFGYRLDDHRAM
jgi:two-component system OmpR family response regulator